MRYLWFSLLLALGVRALSLPRGLSEPDSVDRLLDARQVGSITSGSIGIPTQSVIITGSALSDTPSAAGSTVASLTTNPVATPTSNSIPAISNAPTTRAQTTPISTRSTPLSNTQTSISTRPSGSATNTETSAPVTDINIPFSQSKYHIMIIALSCFSVGLLVAFIVTVILALRARSDVELLRDRLNRYEEGLLASQQKGGSPYNTGYAASRSLGQGSYGRVSTNDPDESTGLYPNPSTSEVQLASPPSMKGGMAKGPRSQSSHRRVTFSADDHSAGGSPPLSTTTSQEHVPHYSQTQPLSVAPKPTDPYASPALMQSPPQLTSSPPPQSNFTSTAFTPPSVHPTSLQPRMSDPGRVATPPIRRLPTTPGASINGHEGSGYTDPFATSHGRSASGGYPPR